MNERQLADWISGRNVRRRPFALSLALAGTGLLSALSAQTPASSQAAGTPPSADDSGPKIAFRRAAIETASKTGRIDDGVLVISGSKIEAVGKSVAIPETAKVVDAAGKFIVPGVIEPYYPLVQAIPGVAGPPRTVTIRGRTITLPGGTTPGVPTFTRIADQFSGYDPAYKPLPRSGLAYLHVVPGGFGQSAVARVTPANPTEMIKQPDGSLSVSISNDSNSLDLIRRPLEAVHRIKQGAPPAAEAPATPTRSPSPTSGGPGPRPGGRRGNRPTQGPMPAMARGPISPEQLALWTNIYEGKATLFVRSGSAAAVAHLLDGISEYKSVKLAINLEADQAWHLLDQLVGKQVTLLITPDIAFEPTNRNRINLAKRLDELKIPFAFTQVSRQGEMMWQQDVPMFAISYLMKTGLSRQSALEALTIRPAQLIGLDKDLGSLEANKQATFLVFDGDPFDPMSRLRQVWVEGQAVYDR